jgi:hypothetical protein
MLSKIMNRTSKFLGAAILWTLAGAHLRADTNLFQGFHPGDRVHVKSDRPLTMLNKALFEGQTTNSISIVSKGERYFFDKTNVVLTATEDSLSPAQTRRKAWSVFAAASAPGAAAPTSLKPEDLESQIMAVQQAVLGGHSDDPHYAEAKDYYQKTLDGFLSGRVTMPELVGKAEDTLKKLDEFLPERQKDPRFEDQIRLLRDFVLRARSGEGFGKPQAFN